MELDENQADAERDLGSRELDQPAEIGAKFAALANDGGVEARQRRAMVMAALFDEPIESAKIGRFTIVRRPKWLK